ncbi:TPA: AraC family transcriptional regulator [Candidatus Micrarchaeota archaeon]|nr:AraC family transcriptional regulator [Candidatus Micrarchaeota archaeon]
MVVALYNGNGRDELRANLLNDSRYVHFSCLLRGISQGKVRRKVIAPSVGEGHIGFAPGERFSVQYSPDYRHVELMVTPEVLSELVGDEFERIGDIDSGFIMRATPPGNQTIDAATRLAQRIEHQGQSPLLLHAAVLEFLGWHFEGLSRDGVQDSLPLRERRRLLAARERLLEDLSAPPTIAELAMEVGLNQLKLKQGFKSLFGTSVYALFQRHRMERARDLLYDHNVTETALILGYSNISHFSTAFRKQFGVLPSEARKSILF